MSVLIFIDHADGHVKKASFEALTYGADVAKQLGVSAEGLLLGTVNDDLTSLGKYGITKIHQVNNEALNQLDAQVYAKVVEEAVASTGAKVVVFSHNQTGKAIAPRVAAGLKAVLLRVQLHYRILPMDLL
jgi:electron transfer flavoprotein alpha subunit